MTMDIANQQRSDQKMPSPKVMNEFHVKSEYTSPPSTITTKSSQKRSFDVAFLMMPDDRIRQKQMEKHARIQEYMDRHPTPPTDLSPKPIASISPDPSLSPDAYPIQNAIRFPQITVRTPRIYDDPSILPERVYQEMENPKSAFTKVAQQTRLDSPIPPPLSPDQMSCPSMSPPVSKTPPRTQAIYHPGFRPEYHFNGGFQTVGQVQAMAAAQNNRIKHQFMYRPMTSQTGPPPEIMAGYLPAGAFPFSGPGNPFVHQPDITGIVRNPAAAAILSTLIPPTLATTFTLTAQNVCAKCNISFRMTSDLVYHMRSHHKSEVASDMLRRKRDEKLKCPVCNESFRERHHLTRHMTAHQDKESDQADPVAQAAAKRK